MKDIRRICNLIVDLLKLTSNKNILSKVIVLGYNQAKLCLKLINFYKMISFFP